VPGSNVGEIRDGDVDRWANKGWVDLRPANFARWHDRFREMERVLQRVRGRGSATITHDAYLYDDIRIGTIVSWIFNTEDEGYRIK